MSVHMRRADLISRNAPADGLRGHGHGGRYGLDGRDQFRDYLPLAVVVRVKNEPHYTAANIFDFGEAGNKYIRYAEWFRQICRHLSLQSRAVNAAPGNYASHVRRNHGGGSFHSRLMVNGVAA